MCCNVHGSVIYTKMHSVVGVLEAVEKTGFAHAEWDKHTDVMIYCPGVEMFFGLLDPYTFLYERAFSMDEAIYVDDEPGHVLTQSGGAHCMTCVLNRGG